MENLLEFTTQPIWDTVIQIRKKVKSVLEERKYPAEIIEATEIVSMELLENAVKYGVCTEDCPAVDVKIEINESDKEIGITVSNGFSSVENLEFILSRLDKLKNADNIEALYMERLEEIIANPRSGKSQLGLYRIAYETGYKLDYKLKGNRLEITGKKKIGETLP
ncbi:MAG TPA: DUF6272 family protein [Leptospiraceae bacterium]|nr:DUF6272 family protein [Leptospiraceae bacterium]HRG75101.1 DUF6272 family protein [Leptospiraceae bacterium]